MKEEFGVVRIILVPPVTRPLQFLLCALCAEGSDRGITGEEEKEEDGRIEGAKGAVVRVMSYAPSHGIPF